MATEIEKEARNPLFDPDFPTPIIVFLSVTSKVLLQLQPREFSPDLDGRRPMVTNRSSRVSASQKL
jgi:hypothetical protein